MIVRQRPGTAKGLCFLTLEDETGTANAFVTPPLYERARVVLNTSPLLEVAGRLERVDGVTHVRAARFRRHRGAGGDAGGTRLLVKWTVELRDRGQRSPALVPTRRGSRAM